MSMVGGLLLVGTVRNVGARPLKGGGTISWADVSAPEWGVVHCQVKGAVDLPALGPGAFVVEEWGQPFRGRTQVFGRFTSVARVAALLAQFVPPTAPAADLLEDAAGFDAPAPLVEQLPAPVVEDLAPLVEQLPAPVVEDLAPLVEQLPAPVVEQAPALVEAPALLVEQAPAPVVEQAPAPKRKVGGWDLQKVGA